MNIFAIQKCLNIIIYDCFCKNRHHCRMRMLTNQKLPLTSLLAGLERGVLCVFDSLFLFYFWQKIWLVALYMDVSTKWTSYASIPVPQRSRKMNNYENMVRRANWSANENHRLPGWCCIYISFSLSINTKISHTSLYTDGDRLKEN